MNETIMARRKTRHFAGELEQGHIDGAVGHVKPDAGAAGNRHAERLLKEFRGLFGVWNRDGDVTKTGSHGELLLEESNLDRKIPPRLRSQAGRENRLRGVKAFPDQVGPTLLSSPGLTGSRACPTSAPIKWSKSETSDFDWRSSNHRPGILDCPVKPGNDTDRVKLIKTCSSAPIRNLPMPVYRCPFTARPSRWACRSKSQGWRQAAGGTSESARRQPRRRRGSPPGPWPCRARPT